MQKKHDLRAKRNVKTNRASLMSRNVDRADPPVPFHEPLVSKDAALAKKLQAALLDFRETVKHLNHTEARSAPSLSHFRKIIKHLDELSHEAKKLR
jgi:hypothetical protein